MEQVVFLVCHAGFGLQVVLACICMFPAHIMLKEFAKKHITRCVQVIQIVFGSYFGVGRFTSFSGGCFDRLALFVK